MQEHPLHRTPGQKDADVGGATDSRPRAFIELLRLPAVFTALADVAMGYLVTQGTLRPLSVFALLAASSSLLYLAGMVLNDVYDAVVDTRERPERPIPSGRVSYSAAARLGWGLLVVGVCLAWLVSWLGESWRPGVVGSLLAGCVVLYDAVMKRTGLAPLVMGACRALNVLLGMSLAAPAAVPNALRQWTIAEWGLAVSLGVYVVGITVFARTEAIRSSRWRLFAGVLIMFVGAAAMIVFATQGEPAERLPGSHSSALRLLLVVVLPLLPILRPTLAIMWPNSRTVQFGVRGALRGIIWLDAFATVFRAPGSGWPLVIVLLMVPMFLLESRVSTT